MNVLLVIISVLSFVPTQWGVIAVTVKSAMTWMKMDLTVQILTNVLLIMEGVNNFVIIPMEAIIALVITVMSLILTIFTVMILMNVF
jgi:hypothetical protein